MQTKSRNRLRAERATRKMVAEYWSDDLHAIKYCESMIRMYQNEIAARRNHLQNLGARMCDYTIRHHRTHRDDVKKRDADRALGWIKSVPTMIVGPEPIK